jgi:autotransporter adhesin
MATAMDSTASGQGSQAIGVRSSAFGQGASALADYSSAFGQNASALASNSVALGANSVATRENSVSVGSPGNERQIVNVAEGTRGTDAVNLTQMRRGLAMTAALQTPTLEPGKNNALKIGGAEFGDSDFSGNEVGISIAYARRLNNSGLSADISIAADVEFKEQVARVGFNYSW